MQCLPGEQLLDSAVTGLALVSPRSSQLPLACALTIRITSQINLRLPALTTSPDSIPHPPSQTTATRCAALTRGTRAQTSIAGMARWDEVSPVRIMSVDGYLLVEGFFSQAGKAWRRSSGAQDMAATLPCWASIRSSRTLAKLALSGSRFRHGMNFSPGSGELTRDPRILGIGPAAIRQ